MKKIFTFLKYFRGTTARERIDEMDAPTTDDVLNAAYNSLEREGPVREWPPFADLVTEHADDSEFILEHACLLTDRDIVACNGGLLLDRPKLLAYYLRIGRVARILERPDVDPTKRFAAIGLTISAEITNATLKTSSGDRIVYSRRYFDRSVLVIHHARGRHSINIASVLSFHLLDNHIIVNGYSSPFELSLDDKDRERLDPLFVEMDRCISMNVESVNRRVRRDGASSQNVSESMVNPWIVAGIGLVTGIAIS